MFLTALSRPRTYAYSTNLVIILGMMQVSKKIPFDDPQVLLGVRILYVVSNLIIFGVYYYCSMKIAQKKGASLGTFFSPDPD